MLDDDQITKNHAAHAGVYHFRRAAAKNWAHHISCQSLSLVISGLVAEKHICYKHLYRPISIEILA